MKKTLIGKYLTLGMIAFILIISGTFAYWMWSMSNEDNTNVAVTIDIVKILYIKGPDVIGANLKPTFVKEDGVVKEIEVSTDRKSETTINFYLDIVTLPEGLRDETFKWELYKNGEFVNSNNFALNIPGQTLNLAENLMVEAEVDKYELYIWIDGNYENSVEMGGQPYLFTLRADGYNAILEEENIYTSENCFAFESETGTITRYYNNEYDNAGNPLCPKDVVIPETINGVDVEILSDAVNAANGVFYQSNITSLVLPNTLTTIGAYSVYRNNLEGIITIPKTVKTIGNSAFAGTSSGTSSRLAGVIFESDSILKSIGDYAFGYNQLSGTITIPKGVETIGQYSFAGNSTTNQIDNVVFESGSILESIGNSAFSNNKLSGVLTIPKTVKTIGNNAFYGNTNGSTNSITNIIFESGSILESIGNSAFSYNKLRETLTIPKNVKTIGDQAFFGNINGSTNAITSIVFENGSILESIGGQAFYHNKLSGTLTIPKTVKKIGNNAFYGNINGSTNAITSIVFESGSILESIGPSAFQHNKLSGTIIFPKSLQMIETSSFEGKIDGTTNQLTNVIFENGSNIARINNYAFSNNNLSSFMIPSTASVIGVHIVKGNNNLSTIINQTGRSLLWCGTSSGTGVIDYQNCSPTTSFATGTVTYNDKTITITAS